MADLKHPDQAHVFILKLWKEVISEDPDHRQTEWRGRIQDVRNGETHYFRDWHSIVHFISNILPDLEDHKSDRGRKRTAAVKAVSGRR